MFTIIILNSFSGRLPISSSFVRSGGFLPCSFICCVFLCLLILLSLLCLGSPFYRLQVHNSRCFWCLSPVAKVGSVACVCFLVEGTSSFVLVDEAGSSLSGGQVHVWWCVLVVFLVGRSTSGGVFWLSVALLRFMTASLLMGGVVFLSCSLFGIGCPAL